jgi:membrane protease subunit HflK
VASRGIVATNASGKRNPPVNLLSLSIPVQYQVTNLMAWVYGVTEPAVLLEQMATREVVRYLASADMQELMSVARFPAGETLRQRLQAQADAMNLGVRIVFVGLQDIHPPVRVARIYEDVVKARQEREAAILDARAYALATNGLARSEAMRVRRRADGDRRRLEVTAESMAALFTNQMPAYRAAPEVYQERAYLETLSRGSADARKLVSTSTNVNDLFYLNLEEKFSSGLIGAGIPEPRPRP